MPTRNWSISCTVRNPNRVIDFLRVLTQFEGRPFNTTTQAAYQKELIRNKLYKVLGLPERLENYYHQPELIPNNILNQIFRLLRDPDLRGRTSVSPLNKLGAVIAREAAGNVIITDTGRALLDPDANIPNIFLKYLLKWQFPNPFETRFSRRNRFKIIPFVATLHLIKKVNELWSEADHRPVGISKKEFAMFVPTLINYENIGTVARVLIDFRARQRALPGHEQEQFYQEELKNRVIRIYGLDSTDEDEIRKKKENLQAYADSIIRYFSMTGFIRLRGRDHYVDLSELRETEVNALLEEWTGEPLDFETDTTEGTAKERYTSYITDPQLPKLPWENLDDLRIIASNLQEQVNSIQTDLQTNYTDQTFTSYNTTRNLSVLNETELTIEIKNLRQTNTSLSTLLEDLKSQNPEILASCINQIKIIPPRSEGLNFEIELAKAIRSVNDFENIKPHYIIDDNNQPVHTALGNKPDLESHYKGFYLVCEVTTKTNRDQWQDEHQPVQRHVKDFMDSNTDKVTYCLFIAPAIHRDTKNTFWESNKTGYEGTILRIIPLSNEQFCNILSEILAHRRANNFSHQQLGQLLRRLHRKVKKVTNSDDWINSFDEIIGLWSEGR